MSRSIDRRTFLKGVAVLAAAAPAAALAGTPASAADSATAPAATPPPASGPDLSICRTPEERALLERQYASALALVKTIREAPLALGVEPVTAFAARPRPTAPAAADPAAGGKE